MKKQIVPIAVIAVVLLAGLALWFGLRSGGESVPAGEVASGVTIFAPQDTEIIVFSDDETEDNIPEKFIVPASGKYGLDLESGDYTLLVTRGDDYYPWQKKVTVTPDIATEFYPILFPQNPELEVIDSSHDVYGEVSQAFSVPATLPTQESPKENVDGTAELYVEGNTIFVNWIGELADMPEFLCPGENVEECRLLPAFDFDEGTLENLEFYGDHSEIFLLDRGSAITALEIDRRGGIEQRNQHPIYIGTAPAFRIVDGEIYISDGGVVSRVVLD